MIVLDIIGLKIPNLEHLFAILKLMDLGFSMACIRKMYAMEPEWIVRLVMDEFSFHDKGRWSCLVKVPIDKCKKGFSFVV